MPYDSYRQQSGLELHNVSPYHQASQKTEIRGTEKMIHGCALVCVMILITALSTMF